MSGIDDLKDKVQTSVSDSMEISSTTGTIGKSIAGLAAVFLLAIGGLGFYWNDEPDLFDVREVTRAQVQELGTNEVTGSTTVATMIEMADVLLHKRGGYLHNDLAPPGAWMDNVPNWEFGVLVQMRDMARTMRNNLSRSQSQSTEDPDLVVAEGQFYFDNNSWMLPETEAEYEKGVRALESYLNRLGDNREQSAQFYARADNLRIWLSEVETRLGSLSQRLSRASANDNSTFPWPAIPRQPSQLWRSQSNR